MADKFEAWDRFAQHHALTQDPHKALRWTRHEMRLHRKRMRQLQREADRLADASMLKALGEALKKTI